jgi:glycogen debranching enzyme
MRAQARLVGRALLDVTLHQPDHQLPELFGGYARRSGTPPLPYVESCRPQAWSAAALLWAAHATQ